MNLLKTLAKKKVRLKKIIKAFDKFNEEKLKY